MGLYLFSQSGKSSGKGNHVTFLFLLIYGIPKRTKMYCIIYRPTMHTHSPDAVICAVLALKAYEECTAPITGTETLFLALNHSYEVLVYTTVK